MMICGVTILLVGILNLNCAKQRTPVIFEKPLMPDCKPSVQKLIDNPREPLRVEVYDLLECIELMRTAFK